MILQLAETCPIFQPSAERHLQHLLYTIASGGWHLIGSPTPERLQVLLPDHLWNLYSDILLQPYKQAANSPMTAAAYPDCGACDPEKLATFLTLPVAVIVEDIHTDGEWLKFVADKLKPGLARRMTAQPPILELRHAGGIGQIPKELARVAPRYLNARQAPNLPLRVVTIADSDAKLPGRISDQAKAVRDAAGEVGADCHILQKRTIENYIPDESLMDYASRRRGSLPAAIHITNLSRRARDHYPIKHGLTQAEIDEVSELYGRSPQTKIGMGDFIGDYLTNFAYATEPHQLKRRDHTNDLEDMLSTLERNI